MAEAAFDRGTTEGSVPGFDLDRMVASRLDSLPSSDPHLQALAVLIDADLTEVDRAEAVRAMMQAFLANLTSEQRSRFAEIAEGEGEVAALSYLSTASLEPRGTNFQ